MQCTRCTPEKISELDESINNYNKLRNKLIKSEYYTKSDFYCTKHCDNIFHSFCRKCNLNICERCLNRHHNHEKIELNKLILDQRDIFINKIKIRKKKEVYDKIIENIIKTKNEIDNEINGLINMIRLIIRIKIIFILKILKISLIILILIFLYQMNLSTNQISKQGLGH